MTPATALLLVSLAAVTTPDWYTGRHAVLLLVDGLGDGELEARLRDGQLPAVKRHLIDAGRRLESTAWWPQRGVGEACHVVTGHPQGLLDSACLVPPLLADDARAVQVADGSPGRDLSTIAARLGSLPADALPPMLLVVHDARFARAALAHGRGSLQAMQALNQLDFELDLLVEWYRARGLLERTSLVLASPAGVPDVARRLDVDALLAPLLPPRERRQGRLQDLLHAFSPLDVRHRGGLTLVQPRRTQSAGAVVPDATLGELLDATGRGRRSASAVLQELARSPGVALVVAREARSEDGEVLAVVGPGGQARLEQRARDQLRYTPLRGRDPLAQGAPDPDLERARFHAAELWLARPGPVAGAVARAGGLLALEPGSALALVAEDGARFDDDGSATGLRGQPALWVRGLGVPPAGTRVELRQVGPSLLALVGAPLDPLQASRVVEEMIEVDQTASVQAMCRELVRRTAGAFAATRVHEGSLVDTSELRRFGSPPPYFAEIERGLGADDPLGYLPEENVQLQIGPRRALLVAATRLSARIERLVLEHRPVDIRRFDPLLRPELLLAGLLADSRQRALLRVLEGPSARARARAQCATPAVVAP